MSIGDALIAAIPDLEQKRHQARERLLEILRKADRPELVAQAALTYQINNPETFKESETERLPSHLEYLALQAAGIGLAADSQGDVIPAEQLYQTDEAMQLVQEIFVTSMMLLPMRSAREIQEVKDKPSILDEFQVWARVHSMSVRGSGYVEHLDRVAFSCLDPIKDDCSRVLGFTAREAIQLIEGIEELWLIVSTRGSRGSVKQLRASVRSSSGQGVRVTRPLVVHQLGCWLVCRPHRQEKQ